MLLALQQNLLLGDVTLVEVPDVVGETQAAGTATLEGEGFVVAVDTAHSSVVAAGLIISQDPAGGIEYPEGGTVTIVVSLGEAPAAVAGGHYWPTSRKKRRDPLEDRIEEQRQEALRLREAIERAIRGEPDETAQVATESPAAPEEPAKSPVPGPEPSPTDATVQLRALESDLARTERAIARYEALEAKRQARSDDIEAGIVTSAEALLDAIEEELSREAKRLTKITRH